jgi:hypothetical protein
LVKEKKKDKDDAMKLNQALGQLMKNDKGFGDFEYNI